MKTVTLPVSEFASFLKSVSAYVDMTKEANAAPSFDSAKIDKVVNILCTEGFIPEEKRAHTLSSLKANPSKICDILEKLAKKAGPSSLGEADSYNISTGDAGSAFVDFCLQG